MNGGIILNVYRNHFHKIEISNSEFYHHLKSSTCHTKAKHLIDAIKSVRFGFLMKKGFEILKKMNFMITIMYKIPTFSSVGPFFEEREGV